MWPYNCLLFSTYGRTLCGLENIAEGFLQDWNTKQDFTAATFVVEMKCPSIVAETQLEDSYQQETLIQMLWTLPNGNKRTLNTLQPTIFFLTEYHYRPQTKFAKVMFSQVSFCPRGGVSAPLHAGIHPPDQRQTPHWADTPEQDINGI